jgi:hypothetical protein
MSPPKNANFAQMVNILITTPRNVLHAQSIMNTTKVPMFADYVTLQLVSIITLLLINATNALQASSTTRLANSVKYALQTHSSIILYKVVVHVQQDIGMTTYTSYA